MPPQYFNKSHFLLGLLLCLVSLNAVGANARHASDNEIQKLFDLAKYKPQRLRIIADISSDEVKLSDEQVAAEIQHQNDLYKDLARLPEAQQKTRTNAVVRSHSGKRVLHVREWYSGNYYRLDQTDESMVAEDYIKKHGDEFRNSFVNIDDPTISPYRSFFVDHELRDAQLSKTTLYGRNELWCALGLERQLSFPLLMALVDSRTLPQLTSGAEADSTGIQMSPQKRDLLRDGAHPIWNLTASASDGDGLTRFILRGTTMSLMAPFEESEMEFLYDVKDIGGKFICVKASFTNYTAHNALLSERGNFDSEGFPRYWKRTSIESNASPKHIDVVLKEIDLNPAFKNDVVFAPRFPTNYIVSDVTSGTAVILQNPLVSRVAEQPLRSKAFRKRILVLWVLGLVALATGVALWRFASKGQ